MNHAFWDAPQTILMLGVAGWLAGFTATEAFDRAKPLLSELADFFEED